MVKGIGKNVFILGIGGISLSSIARILKNVGHEVSGYDKVLNEQVEKLIDSGFNVVVGKSCNEEIMLADTLIFTSAISEDCLELATAKQFNIQILTRAEALFLISESFDEVVAVAGSHGKTTTTAMLASVLNCLDNFTAHVGGVVSELASNTIINGNGGVFLTEACEYKRNFLKLMPTISVILNMDLDHIDCYKDQDEITDAFIDFSKNTQNLLVLNIDDPHAGELLIRTTDDKSVITYSLSSSLTDYRVKSYHETNEGMSFEVEHRGRSLGEFKMQLKGKHNLYNALATIIVARELQVELKQIKRGLLSFKGVKRRQEKIGEINGASVILDYAHHPIEIETIIDEHKRKKGKCYVVFQPHTYTRTKYFWSGFIKSLLKADSLVLYPIYSAREKAIAGITSKRMAEDLRKMKKVCYYSNSLIDIKTYLSYFVTSDDVVLVLGAGDIEEFRGVLVDKNNHYS